MESPIIAANWKMHKTRSEVEDFFNVFLSELKDEQAQIWIAPSATTLHLSAQKSQKKPSIWVGAQNICFESQGAFTGEISARQVADAGARFVITGHSERRHLFCETNAQIEKKITQAIKHRLVPLLCVGETLEERKSGKTKTVLKTQLTEALCKCSTFNGVIGYEPIWAIGTGQTADSEIIEEAHTFCREILTQICKEGDRLPILYGGSVTKQSIFSLKKVKTIDGILVGSASLDAHTFISIIREYLL